MLLANIFLFCLPFNRIQTWAGRGTTIWQQNDRTFYCPRESTFPWQPYFDRHVFQNVDFSYFKLNNSILVVDHLEISRSFYGVFIPFNYFSADFGRIFFRFWKKSTNSRWWTKMAATQTFSDVRYLPSKSPCHSFYIL